MSDQIIIAKGVSLSTLNPQNFALKNDYMNNLISTAFMAFPVAAEILGDRKFFVKRGFQSHAYVTEEVESAITSELIKHTKGLAVEFTWEGWTEENALVVGKAIYQQIADPVNVIVNTENRTVYVGRGYNNSVLMHRSLNENRALARAA